MTRPIGKQEEFLQALVGLFYPNPEQLGLFTSLDADELPSAYRDLLAHSAHMTVTVEARHSSPVDVQVLNKRHDPGHYSREILLRRQSDQRTVQYGIVRLATNSLADDVLAEIFSERIPLGRALIQHGVMTQVQLLGLWRVAFGNRLRELMTNTIGMALTYGRTALIYCNGEPAVELLEIVAPEESFA